MAVLRKIRIGTDITLGITVMASGHAVDWNSQDIKHVYAFSDIQGQPVAEMSYEQRGSTLRCVFHAEDQNYVGAYRVIIEFNDGSAFSSTLDMPAFEIVRTSEEADIDTGEIVLDIDGSMRFYSLAEVISKLEGLHTEVKAAASAAREASDNANAAAKKANEAAALANSNASKAEASNKVINDNERKRIAQETARESAEAERKRAELERQKGDESIAIKEAVRVRNEEVRETNEQTRKDNELERRNAESARNRAETQRASRETTRISNETSRQAAENKRVAAETSRQEAETSRVNVESERVTEFARLKKESEEATKAASAVSDVVAQHTKKITKIEQLLQEGYTFMGVATPEINPGTPEQKVFYIANGKGTYANFGGLNVDEDEVVLLIYDDTWKKLPSGIASYSELFNLDKTFVKGQEASTLEYTFKAGAIYRIYSDASYHATRNTKEGPAVDTIGEIHGSAFFIPTANAKYLRVGAQNALSNTIRIEHISASVKELLDSTKEIKDSLNGLRGIVVEIKGVFGAIVDAISAGLTTGDTYVYNGGTTDFLLGTFTSPTKASYIQITNDSLFILNGKLYRADVANRNIVLIKDDTLYESLGDVKLKLDRIAGDATIISNSHHDPMSYQYNFIKGLKYSVLIKNSKSSTFVGLRTTPDGSSFQGWRAQDNVAHTFVAENNYSYLRVGLFNNVGSIEVSLIGELDEINDKISRLKTRSIISKLAYSESERVTITDELDGFVFNPSNEQEIFCKDFYDRLITKFDALVTAHSGRITKYDSVTFVNDTLQEPLEYPEYANLNGQASGKYLPTPSYTIPIYKIGLPTSSTMNQKRVNIVLIAGQHGWEISSPFNSYVFARHLLEASTGNYAKLLQSANIYILPLLNVYGCYHGYYVNANGVNLNRNYPYDGWTPIEGTAPFDSQYAGTEAGSEFETKLAMAVLNKIKPQIALDMHGNGADNYYVYLSNPSYAQAFSANDLLADYTSMCQKEYPQFFGTEYKPLWQSNSLSVSESLDGGRYLDSWIWKNICQIGGTFEVNLSIYHKDGVRDVNTYKSEFMGKNAVTLNEWQLRNFIAKLWNLLPQ